MTSTDELLRRVCARSLGRAVPYRSTYSLATDPAQTFAVAFVRVAAEERVQAVAFGDPRQPPQTLTIVRPLARHADDLLLFARALDEYLTRCTTESIPARIWLGHPAAFAVLDLLGHRYATNRFASEPLRRMGRACRALCDEAEFADQQAVAIAGHLLAAHVVTGQSPAEDRHLGALLAWLDPSPGTDPAEEARRRALTPAASLLAKDDDDQVEDWRRAERACKSQSEGELLRRRIRERLTAGVLYEWNLLTEAREAFWRLDLPYAPKLEDVQRASAARLARTLSYGGSALSYPDQLVRRLDELEYAAACAEERDACYDEQVRERLRGQGRVIVGRIVAVEQPVSGSAPCTITLITDQTILRVRPGTRLKSTDGRFRARVLADGGAGGEERRLTLRVTSGVRRDRVPAAGEVVCLTDTIPFDGRHTKRQTCAQMRLAASPVIYGGRLPEGVLRALPPGSLIEAAENLRCGREI